jgi:uncharacterized membrane protein YphA (DoxX/SURF4 family)
MYFTHLRNGLFLPAGVELVPALCGLSLALALAGAGRVSLDRVLAERRASR